MQSLRSSEMAFGPRPLAFCLLLFLLTINIGRVSANNRFVFHTFKPIVVGRIDPAMAPGQVSQHVHMVIGGSNFNATYDPVKLRQSKCTNMAVQADKSNYWQPNVYRVLSNGSFAAMQSSTRIYYELQPANYYDGGKQKIEPFPYNFRMIAGDPARKALNAYDPVSGTGQWWMRWACDKGPKGVTLSWTIPQEACGNLITKVFFPNCWNGKDFDVSNPNAHMRYPTTDGYDGPTCPSTHPRRLPSIEMETFYYKANDHAHGGQLQYILANGDTTGYGLHADFANGWDQAVLAAAIKDCYRPPVSEPANHACKHFVASYKPDVAEKCFYQNKIPDEPVGYQFALRNLPGCNLVWGNTPNKPRCSLRMFTGNGRWVWPAKNLFQWSLWAT